MQTKVKTRKLVIILFLIFILFPLNKIHSEKLPSNIGFVPTNIWYSKDPFTEGDNIQIYTLVFNPDEKELKGTVVFFDNNTILGKKNFSLRPKSVKDISIDWTVTTGKHVIFAQLQNTKFVISKGEYETIFLKKDTTEKSSRTVYKKIIPDKIDVEEAINQTANNISEPIKEFKNKVTNKIPTTISKPINGITNVFENFRKKNSTSFDNKKSELSKSIEITKKEEITENNKKETNKISKPMQYVKLFFITLFSIIFKSKIIFYSLILISLMLIIRFVWRKIVQ